MSCRISNETCSFCQEGRVDKGKFKKVIALCPSRCLKDLRNEHIGCGPGVHRTVSKELFFVCVLSQILPIYHSTKEEGIKEAQVFRELSVPTVHKMCCVPDPVRRGRIKSQEV